jgi:hypothetical protein
MSGGARRLGSFLGVLLGVLVAFEALCRAQSDGLGAIAHRVHFKLALLKQKGPVDFVTLGSSRSNDGLGPALLGLGVGFSASTPSTSLPSLEYFASHLGPQKRVLVEVSRPTFNPAVMDDVVVPPPGAFEGDPVGAWLSSHSALLRLRRAFALENLPRVFALLFASRFDGSEWFRSRQLLETFRDDAPPPDVHDDAAWVPFAHDLTQGSTLDEDGARVVAGYERLVASLRSGGAQVVLMAPPLGLGWRSEECTPAFNELRREVARRTQAPLLDFTCAEVSEAWFLEGQHLSSPGRAKYSQVLGEAVRALP